MESRKTTLGKAGAALDAPDSKREYNERLFARIAPRYDLINRWMSFGRDSQWKDRLVARLPPAAMCCLDVACGTGDLTTRLARRYPGAEISGVDLTEPMLEIARRRLAGSRVRFVRGDMCRLDVPDGSVDVLTGGYALRNAPDLDGFLAEVHRVLKPGGTCAFLDFSKSENPVLAAFYLFLIRIWGGFWSLLLHRNPHLYGYIAESLERFPARDRIGEHFETHGLTLKYRRRQFFGMAEMLEAEKRS